jgi:small subunit ribosomal protein S8
MVDPIADMLCRMRNGLLAKHKTVDIPRSRLKLAIVQLFQREGFVQGYKSLEDGRQGIIRILLKYNAQNRSIISGLKRASTPGLRVYAGKAAIPRVLSGAGIAIISTSQGVLCDREARARGIGGEVLCYIW